MRLAISASTILAASTLLVFQAATSPALGQSAQIPKLVPSKTHEIPYFGRGIITQAFYSNNRYLFLVQSRTDCLAMESDTKGTLIRQTRLPQCLAFVPAGPDTGVLLYRSEKRLKLGRLNLGEPYELMVSKDIGLDLKSVRLLAAGGTPLVYGDGTVFEADSMAVRGKLALGSITFILHLDNGKSITVDGTSSTIQPLDKDGTASPIIKLEDPHLPFIEPNPDPSVRIVRLFAGTALGSQSMLFLNAPYSVVDGIRVSRFSITGKYEGQFQLEMPTAKPGAQAHFGKASPSHLIALDSSTLAVISGAQGMVALYKF